MQGTHGYASEAAELFVRYESFGFEHAHAAVLHLMPTTPGRVLDIGSGTGRDAAYLAAKGHRVVAVEPTGALRQRAAALHKSPAIEWIDDGLPDLERIVARPEHFELILLSAVWMHLDADERRAAMPVIAGRLAPGGRIVMTLRHGPVPAGRTMFPVTAEETMALAMSEGLTVEFNRHAESRQAENRRAGISWTTLVFARPAYSAAAAACLES